MRNRNSASRTRVENNLSEKQRRFVAEYLVDLNATQAAIRAGYSKKTANEQGARLLANASVAEAVRKGQEKKLTKAELKAEEVIQTIRETIARCKGAGKEFNPHAILKGCELLGRHLGMFKDAESMTFQLVIDMKV
jgi:phage terminase small subunit